MKKINIEIMPTEKSCEQGCPQCPMARHNSTEPKKAKLISRKVQKSFSLLECFLQKKQVKYDMHFASLMKLFPKIKHPDLLQMARFESERSINVEKNQPIYSDEIRKVINKQKLNPVEICFSYVPKSPIISHEESDIIKNIMSLISDWYLDDNMNKRLSCTIRSNFYPQKKFEQTVQELKKSDKLNLEGALDKFSKSKSKFEISEITDFQGSLYFSELTKKYKKNLLKITNRIIVHQIELSKIESDFNNKNFETHQAIHNSCLSAGFMIEPGGVMMNHTSLSINNPILWLSHKDFHNILARYHRKNVSIKKMISELVIENCVMYDCLKRELPDYKFKKGEFMHFFENFREKFRNKIKQPKSKAKK
jgi:hypothetical protein